MEVGEVERPRMVVDWSFHAEGLSLFEELLSQEFLCFCVSGWKQEIHRLYILINHLVGNDFNFT
jgi:hypothetical protein